MSCGQIPAACAALIWGEVMRITSKEGWGSLALVQLGPTAPWDTGQADRAQGALITRSIHPKGGERAEGSSDDWWGSSRALAVDRSERQTQWSLWLELVKGSWCGQYDRENDHHYVFTWHWVCVNHFITFWLHQRGTLWKWSYNCLSHSVVQLKQHLTQEKWSQDG